MSKKKKITVAIKSAEQIEEVAKKLRGAGVSDIAELKHILTITGCWEGNTEEIEAIDGVEAVEVQDTRYFTS